VPVISPAGALGMASSPTSVREPWTVQRLEPWVAPVRAIGSAVRSPEGKGSKPARSTRSVTLPEAGEPSELRGAVTVNS